MTNSGSDDQYDLEAIKYFPTFAIFLKRSKSIYMMTLLLSFSIQSWDLLNSRVDKP